MLSVKSVDAAVQRDDHPAMPHRSGSVLVASDGWPSVPAPSTLKLAVGPDAAKALDAVQRLRAFVEDAELRAVSEARLAGLSWADIGRHLGQSKQAVWVRYAGYDPHGGRIEADD
jgi:hypothetical protein